MEASPPGVYPLTFSFWVKPNSLVTNARMLTLQLSTASSTLQQHALRVNSSGGVQCSIVNNVGGSTANTTNNMTVGVWQHIFSAQPDLNTMNAFLNGTGKASLSGSLNPSAPDRLTVGATAGSTVTAPFDGLIAELGVWNVALDDSIAPILATGISPLLVQPNNLIAYWPFFGNNSPENNLKSNSATMSIVGSLSKAAHPRIFMPRHRLVA
jgi:hypothetical protein